VSLCCTAALQRKKVSVIFATSDVTIAAITAATLLINQSINEFISDY